jgi:ADP-dependent NAD(P)H-hydrate dehydratase / NAD(P)H-hydrate epimerase
MTENKPQLLPEEPCDNIPALWQPASPILPRDVHKYKRGHCLVLSGPELRTGAARLAATAALNAGAGAVTIAGDPAALRIHAAHVTAMMLHPMTARDDLQTWISDHHPAAVICGPAAGINDVTLYHVETVLASGVPAVFDADALSLLSGRHALLKHRVHPSQPIILTPHSGEFARLFPDLDHDGFYRDLPTEKRHSKVEQARAAARLTNAIIVFKGAPTIIAAADGRAARNSNAGPELATAGSGDVLAGLIGSHLAQGMPAFEAAAAAVWLHGHIGAKIGIGLTADRLVAAVWPLARILEASVGPEHGP